MYNTHGTEGALTPWKEKEGQQATDRRNKRQHSQAGKCRERWRSEQATNRRIRGSTHTLASAERDRGVSRPQMGGTRDSTHILVTTERDGGVSRPQMGGT